MDKAYLDRNIANCDTLIASYKARIAKAKATGEDINDLKKSLEGYQDKREELSAKPSEDDS